MIFLSKYLKIKWHFPLPFPIISCNAFVMDNFHPDFFSTVAISPCLFRISQVVLENSFNHLLTSPHVPVHFLMFLPNFQFLVSSSLMISYIFDNSIQDDCIYFSHGPQVLPSSTELIISLFLHSCVYIITTGSDLQILGHMEERWWHPILFRETFKLLCVTQRKISQVSGWL